MAESAPKREGAKPEYYGHAGDIRASTPDEAANNEKFTESADKRKGAESIEDPSAREWLKNIHLLDDYRALLRLYGGGYIAFEKGFPVLNLPAFKGKTAKEFMPYPFLTGAEELRECLARNGVRNVPPIQELSSANELEPREYVKGTIKHPVALPDTFEGLMSGEVGDATYGGNRNDRWYDPITLKDRTVTNAFEVYFAQCMREYGVVRKKEGLFFTQGSLAGETASISKIYRYSKAGATIRGGSFPEGKTGMEIFSHYLSNLRKAGLIQEGDFKIVEQKKELNYMRFVPHKADVALRSPLVAAKYYFGRGTYVHNKKEIPEGTSAMVLDASTAGIFESENGVRVLKYTFPLMTEEELAREKERIAGKLGVSPEELTPSQIIMNVRKSLKKEEIREYSASNYVSPYKSEGPREYARRIESLYNSEATVNAVNEIFMQADLDQFQISWGKKMRLAEAVKRIDKDRIIDFAKRYGVSGLQVFLASEADKGWPEEVLAFAEKLTGLGELFEAYASLLTDEDEFRKTIEDTVFENEEAREYVADLRRASLEDVIAGMRKVMRGEVPLEQVLSKSREGVIAKLSVIKALKKEGLLDSLKDIKGAQLDIERPGEIQETDAQAMRAMYAGNYARTPRLREELLGTFDTNMADTTGKERFFVFKHNGAVKGFYRLEETAPGHRYFGAFNIDPTYKGYRLGETMLAQSLDLEAKDAVIEADCNREAPIAGHYIESGFIGTAAYDFEEDRAMHIIRNDSLRKELIKSAEYSADAIKGMAATGETVERDGGRFVVAAYPVSRVKEMPFDLLERKTGESRYVLSRYLFGKEGGNDLVYTVFERVSEDEFERFRKEAVPLHAGPAVPSPE